MDKKKKSLFIGIGALVIITMIALALVLTQPKTPKDPVKSAYESLNGKTMDNGVSYIEVNLPNDHVIKEKSQDEVLELLDKGTGVIYFGFESCPWCRNAVAVINEAAKQVNLDEVTYVNIQELRDTKVLKGDEVITTKEADPFYTKILEYLGEDAPIYTGLNDPSIKRIPAPFVVVLVDGVVIETHAGTVPTEDPLVALNENEHKQLLDLYSNMFLKVPGCYLGADFCE